MEVPCPSCGKILNIDEKYAGTFGRCNTCQTRFQVPPPPEPCLVAGIYLITTGKLSSKCEIVAIACLTYDFSLKKLCSTFAEWVRPEKRVPDHILKKFQIDQDDLDRARTIRQVMVDLMPILIDSTAIAAWDAPLLKAFLRTGLKNYDGPYCAVPMYDIEAWAASRENHPDPLTLEAMAAEAMLDIPDGPLDVVNGALAALTVFLHLERTSDNLDADLEDFRLKDDALGPPAWRKDPATCDQVDYLESLGFDIQMLPDDMTKGQASDLITSILEEE